MRCPIDPRNADRNCVFIAHLRDHADAKAQGAAPERAEPAGSSAAGFAHHAAGPREDQMSFGCGRTRRVEPLELGGIAAAVAPAAGIAAWAAVEAALAVVELADRSALTDAAPVGIAAQAADAPASVAAGLPVALAAAAWDD